MELKLMMEKLGEPQTHLGLKNMIKEVDEDNDGQISFREVSWKETESEMVGMTLYSGISLSIALTDIIDIRHFMHGP